MVAMNRRQHPERVVARNLVSCRPFVLFALDAGQIVIVEDGMAPENMIQVIDQLFVFVGIEIQHRQRQAMNEFLAERRALRDAARSVEDIAQEV